MKKKKQKLLNSCFAVAVALSATLAPGVANAATPDVPSAVTRIGGYDQYATAALMAQQGWTGTSDSVVLSSGMKYALVDALAAGPLAAKLKAPILLTDNGTTLNASAKAQLLRLKPTKVYITSGTAVIKQSVLDEIRAMGITPVELGGYDQYETSVNIAKEMANQGVNISKVVVAAGWLSPADALSVAPIAAAQGMPILTTTQGQLPASVKTYLDSIDDNVKDSYVVGGTAVVSDAVKGALPGKVSRHAGQTKYDTNVEILKSFKKQYKNDKVYVANGETLVDALSVVPLAAASGSPVVLVNQQLGNATKDFVKLNMSTDEMVAVGGEVVVPSAGMSALTSAVAYSTDSETVGSTNETTPMVLTDNVRLTGDNITLQNAQANYSVYVKGDNITLNNLTVKGTVFVDPGETGTATLDGVTAANIVVLSGASDTIHIKNTTAGVLTVDSSSNVRVEATGTTSIGDTVVRTFAVIDANGGSMGTVTITSTPGQDPVVELRGTFTQPVVVQGQVSLKAAAGAVVPSVVINTESADQKVTLAGSFKAVEVQSQGKLALADNAVVETMKTTAKVDITIPSSSSIGSLDSGSTGTLVSGGGKVNGENTTSTPSTPPSTDNGGSTGGGGGGGGGDDDDDPVDPPVSATEEFIAKIMEVHSELTEPEKASLRVARESIGDLPSDDAIWDTPEFDALVTTGVAAKGVTKSDLIDFISDFSTIYYSEDEAVLEANLNTFKANNSVTFRKLFGTDFTMDEFYGFLIETQDELPGIIGDNLDDIIAGGDLTPDLKELIITWTKEAMHLVVDPVGSDYHIFATKLSEIGWNVDKLVDAQRKLGTVIDPGNAAEEAIAKAAIRSFF